MGNLSSTKIHPGLIRLNETDDNGLNVDAWLVSGSEKAVLIDSLQDTELLYEMVKSLTFVPFEVIITHGHPDHAGKGLLQFLEHDVPVYMHLADLDLLKGYGIFPSEMIEKIQPLKEGMQWDLGDRKLDILECAGHTPGSICVMDWDNQEVFTGDAIGSGGFWMHLKESLPMRTFIENLLHFRQNLVGMKDMIIYPGHIDQQQAVMGMQYIDDVMHICTSLCKDGPQGETGEMTLGNDHLLYRAIGYGQLHMMLYDPEKLG